jgi:Family of unknown function (DUF6502)
MSALDKNAIAAAAISAIAPLIEFLLELGVTSPQAESLLRSIFVHEAHAWLARASDSSDGPSDARVALITGVHRNFVRDILSESPRISKSRQRNRGGADRLIKAWTSDSQYLDGGGRPRDLPIKGPRPSFRSLAAAYLSGAAPGVVLDEMLRAGLLEELPGGRVRFKKRPHVVHGVTVSNVSDFAAKTQKYMRTLISNLQNPNDRLFVDSTPALVVDFERLSVLHEVINQRAATFLSRIEHEFADVHTSQIKAGRRKSKKVGLTIFATQE